MTIHPDRLTALNILQASALDLLDAMIDPPAVQS